VGNWQEERSLYSMTASSRRPLGYPGETNERVTKHRDEEMSSDFSSTTRENYKHPNSYDKKISRVRPRQELLRQRMEALASLEQAEEDAQMEQEKWKGLYSPVTQSSYVEPPQDFLLEQKKSGLYLRSNTYINNLGKPRTDTYVLSSIRLLEFFKIISD
jgi:hypothetical protein